MSAKPWLAFPATYRAEEIKEILGWVKLGESGVVIGGSGSGKSNIAIFLANRPDVTASLLPSPVTDYCFFHLDVNGLPGETPANFYRALLNTMYMATESMPTVQPVIERLIERLPSHEDSFGIYLALQRAHDAVIHKAGKQVIWLLDRFDAACQMLSATTLNTLRSLRDQFKEQLSYIAFTREPLERLRNPTEFDEFYELMAMHTCWVRMMNRRDGLWVAQQVMKRYQVQLEETVIERGYELAGGLPAFLRATYSALARGELPPAQEQSAWINQLLALEEMKRNCREMWESCEEEEQETLLTIAQRNNSAKVDESVVAYLQKLGWLKAGKGTIFSPLFAEYLRRRQQKMGLLSLRGNQILVDGLPTTADFTKHEHDLLLYLLSHQPHLCSKDELMQAVWGDAIQRDDNLTGLVRYVRQKLREQVHTDHDYIKAVHRQGYRFVQVGQS